MSKEKSQETKPWFYDLLDHKCRECKYGKEPCFRKCNSNYSGFEEKKSDR